MIHGHYDISARCFDININGQLVRLDERHDAQKLLQVLWDLGLRPAGREAEMEAVKLHLKDMRRLIFNGE